jgi:hypothetical protein
MQNGRISALDELIGLLDKQCNLTRGNKSYGCNYVSMIPHWLLPTLFIRGWISESWLD